MADDFNTAPATQEHMKAALIEAPNTDPVVRVLPVPKNVGEGRVLVRMRAAALNFADLLKAQGRYQEAEPFPFVSGLEGAGEVIEASVDSALTPGQRVAVNVPGTLCDVVAAPAQQCIPIPDAMSFEEAAGFQIAYGTSHLALVGPGALRDGETLAVLGAAGGVGLTAVQVGRALDARVIAVARGSDKMDLLRSEGADVVIDSDECGDLKTALRDAGGVDVVYDPVGDAPGLAAFGALRQCGRFLVIGFAGGQPPRLPLNHALVKNISIHGYYWGGLRKRDPQAVQASLRDLFKLYEEGRLRPHLGHVLPLDRLAEGFDLLRSRRAVGKVIVTL
ncbi:NADPH:quinone oxidoreductase family protein [Paracoccus sp. TK19116]|uniref:NADPH:quinone oxidoreductase family protein n=1 Tax=Paracoccus albicereus TaxID=2922394 RepID=A0ABT1MRH2_9RHOB|nr:NADPH:quinone oxidoreductase family protein [Paracoccus albicereus]MCQ0970912.1 NADPH:quinone oxidoreductase family protein [Paracoccus albicereus]